MTQTYKSVYKNKECDYLKKRYWKVLCLSNIVMFVFQNLQDKLRLFLLFWDFSKFSEWLWRANGNWAGLIQDSMCLIKIYGWQDLISIHLFDPAQWIQIRKTWDPENPSSQKALHHVQSQIFSSTLINPLFKSLSAIFTLLSVLEKIIQKLWILCGT